MFDQLDLSPMMLLMLLLYGLLIAVVLVLWTALDLGGRRKAQDRPAEPAARQQPEPSRRPPAQQELPPATALDGAKAERRAADSDSVVSYSVRPRVTTQREQPTVAGQPQPAPDEPAVAPRHQQRREPIPTAEVDFPVGRETRQPRADKPATVTPVRPPPARGEQPGNPQRSKSEDAFERFLRSSGNDNDDY